MMGDMGELPPELSEGARESTEAELDAMERLSALFEAMGYRGIITQCGQCTDDHYYTFEMLKGNLRAMLDGTLIPMHEPAAKPKQENYVAWDYAVGYYDGYARAHQEMLHGRVCPPQYRLFGHMCETEEPEED